MPSNFLPLKFPLNLQKFMEIVVACIVLTLQVWWADVFHSSI